MKTQKPWLPLWENPYFAGTDEDHPDRPSKAVSWEKQIWAYSCRLGCFVPLESVKRRAVDKETKARFWRIGEADNNENDPIFAWEDVQAATKNARKKGISLKEAAYEFLNQDDASKVKRFTESPEVMVSANDYDALTSAAEAKARKERAAEFLKRIAPPKKAAATA